MKTLKFMLAAATAIGLASASQAAGPYDGSTDFESDTLNSTITTSDAYWTVPTGAEDGDYTVVSGVPSSALRSAGATSAFTTAPAQVLQLEGGTDPLTRNIQASGAQVNLTAGEVYIDTLVKFTVTPAGDTVTAGASDKLLIYLKEDLTEGSEATNLVVLAALYTPADGFTTTEPTFTPTPVTVSNVSVDPDEWYRLQVKSYTENGIVLFTIKLNGTDLISDTALYTDTARKIFPSLTGTSSTTLTSVGFAGSGAVDDLLFTTFDPEVTVLDFMLVLDGNMQGISGDVTFETTAQSGTLNGGTNTVYCYSASPSVSVSFTPATGFKGTWDTDPNDATITKGAIYTLTVAAEITSVDFTFALGTGVSGVTWTLNGATQSGLTAQVAEGDVLAITGVTYSPWFVGTGDYTNGWTKTLASTDVAANFTYTVGAIELGNSNNELPAGTQPSAVGISNAAITSADLNKVLEWARGKSGAADTAAALTYVNGMDFAEENQAAKAYLLNCENTEAAVQAAEAAFKFPEIVPGTVPSVYRPTGGYNGTVTVKGGAELNAIETEVTSGETSGNYKFFKATLTK